MKPDLLFLLVLAGLLPAPLRAQEPPGPDALPAMRAQAARAVEPALQAVLEHGPAGRAMPWRDAASGLGGEITPGAASLDGWPCRPVRYTVLLGRHLLAVAGRRCRAPDGRWLQGPAADAASLVAPPADPLVRALQDALRRLAYYDGATDGIASPALARALLFFERDEGVAPEAEPTSGLLALADAAVARIPAAGGRCETDGPTVDGVSLACGSVR